MKPITADWLKSAATDLETIDVIASNLQQLKFDDNCRVSCTAVR